MSKPGKPHSHRQQPAVREARAAKDFLDAKRVGCLALEPVYLCVAGRHDAELVAHHADGKEAKEQRLDQQKDHMHGPTGAA